MTRGPIYANAKQIVVGTVRTALRLRVPCPAKNPQGARKLGGTFTFHQSIPVS
jgi:hypothetical protein